MTAVYAYLTVPVFIISPFSDSLEEDVWEQHYQNRKQWIFKWMFCFRLLFSLCSFIL